MVSNECRRPNATLRRKCSSRPAHYCTIDKQRLAAQKKDQGETTK